MVLWRPFYRVVDIAHRSFHCRIQRTHVANNSLCKRCEYYSEPCSNVYSYYLRERDYLVYLDIHRRIILKWILNKLVGRVSIGSGSV